jgi:hypothetical protein
VLKALRWIASAVCWTLAVVAALLTAGGFVSGSFVCDFGEATACPPQTVQLVIGIAATLVFGALGAALWKPKPKDPESDLWDYRD